MKIILSIFVVCIELPKDALPGLIERAPMERVKGAEVRLDHGWSFAFVTP